MTFGVAGTEHRVVGRLPTAEEYDALRRSVGWTVPDRAAVVASLEASMFGVCVEDANHRAVGMARAIADGGLYAFIVDVAVAPTHQGCGHGGRMVRDLVELVVNAGYRSVGLVAAADVADFYGELGFELSDDRFARWPAKARS